MSDAEFLKAIVSKWRIGCGCCGSDDQWDEMVAYAFSAIAHHPPLTPNEREYVNRARARHSLGPIP